jgi:hypothetical protein
MGADVAANVTGGAVALGNTANVAVGPGGAVQPSNTPNTIPHRQHLANTLHSIVSTRFIHPIPLNIMHQMHKRKPR